jgi:hypothetical protein
MDDSRRDRRDAAEGGAATAAPGETGADVSRKTPAPRGDGRAPEPVEQALPKMSKFWEAWERQSSRDGVLSRSRSNGTSSSTPDGPAEGMDRALSARSG